MIFICNIACWGYVMYATQSLAINLPNKSINFADDDDDDLRNLYATQVPQLWQIPQSVLILSQQLELD